MPVELMKDITGAKHVDISTDHHGSVVWVNVDGKCILRICKIEELEILDRRKEEEQKDGSGKVWILEIKSGTNHLIIPSR